MTEIFLFSFLTLLLAIVLYGRWRPILSRDSPLDVEEDLPLPWVGHASTVFSLTALFGAYLAILLFKGAVAVLGLALGSLIGLMLIKSSIERSGTSSHQAFLVQRRFSSNPTHEEAFWMLVAVTQLGYAVSEFLILSRISEVGMQLGPLPSAVLTLTVATIGYLYCLHGGYVGVFRTDVVQFVALGLMVLALATALASSALSLLPAAAEWGSVSSSMHWSFGGTVHWSIQYATDFLIGLIMGAGFLLASPDTWKRMIATIGTGVSPRTALIRMFVAAFVPFLALIPILFLAGLRQTDVVDPAIILVQVGSSSLVMALVVVGLIGAFLSSFDSAVITAVHIFIVKKRRSIETQLTELDRFHLLMGLSFLVVILVALAFTARVQNAYFVANLLMGFYAFIGGCVLGTRFLERPIRSTWASLVGAVLLFAWLVFLLNKRHFFESASEEQLDTVPTAVAIFLASFLLSRLAARSEKV